jgi:succinyl-CoA synthetase alpha subunit
MSILVNKDTRVVIQGGQAGVNAARRMAEFCYLIKRPLNVEAFVYPPDAGKTNEIPYGSGLIAIPIYKTIAEATKNHPTINTSLVYIGADRAMKGGMEALDDSHIKVVSMITEGVPEKDAKILGAHARKLGKVFNGPSSIGIVSAGACRLGVIGGAFDNLVLSKLYREGSFGVIPNPAVSLTRSSGSVRSSPMGSRRRSASAAMPILAPTMSATSKCSKTIRRRRRWSSSAKWAAISKSVPLNGTAPRSGG